MKLASDPAIDAAITFKLRTFRPVKEGSCAIHMDFPEVSGKLWKAPDETGRLVLHVTAPINFTISVLSADTDEYSVLGIAFTQIRMPGDVAPLSDPQGLRNFDNRIVGTGSTLSFRDNWSLNGSGYGYEFRVMIQRARDGAVGIIDPEIENDNEPSR